MIIDIFIDYDNLTVNQKKRGIRDLIASIFLVTKISSFEGKPRCSVRLYGGWYEGESITRLAEDLSLELDRDFPALIRLGGSTSAVVEMPVTAELARSLLQDPGLLIVNTYRKKGRPTNLRVQDHNDVGCELTNCVLPLMKKFLGTGKCPSKECCIESENLIYRHEQKSVDTLLACDIIFAATQSENAIIVVSSDDDLIPPLRVATMHRASVVRVHPRPNINRAPLPEAWGRITEVGL